MTILLLRAAVAPNGARALLDYRLRLVDADGNRVHSIRLSDSSPVFGVMSGRITADADEELELSVLSQEEIATQGGVASYWELTLRPGGTGVIDTYLLSVPASDVPLDLLTLLDAQAAPVDQAAAMAARIAALEANQLPVGAAGDILIHDGSTWIATDQLPVT